MAGEGDEVSQATVQYVERFIKIHSLFPRAVQYLVVQNLGPPSNPSSNSIRNAFLTFRAKVCNFFIIIISAFFSYHSDLDLAYKYQWVALVCNTVYLTQQLPATHSASQGSLCRDNLRKVRRHYQVRAKRERKRPNCA